MHPDKNSAEDAEQQFRKVSRKIIEILRKCETKMLFFQLVAVYDVLKDSGKRQRYDNVLVNGLPNWRSAVYYYRHVRKMGLVELSIILFLVFTVGQYLVGWGAYFEKRYTYVCKMSITLEEEVALILVIKQFCIHCRSKC